MAHVTVSIPYPPWHRLLAIRTRTRAMGLKRKLSSCSSSLPSFLTASRYSLPLLTEEYTKPQPINTLQFVQAKSPGRGKQEL